MKNSVLPYGIIAIVGIFVAVIVFYIGVGQREEIQLAEDGEGTEVVENGDVEEGDANDPEAIYANSCAGCHGDDLTGTSGPDLTAVGSSLSEEEIEAVINEGQGTMPPALVSPEEAAVLAEWLSEMK
ncbi:MAG TPA: cytochrome c [Pseudogracilibacillus sp.]|nr:cytochrome c [Pseudogracilibacillus sp.]